MYKAGSKQKNQLNTVQVNLFLNGKAEMKRKKKTAVLANSVQKIPYT